MMKALLYRDIYIIRKNLLISIGIYTVMSLFGILGILSAKYGNIAKYSPDDIFPRDVMRASLWHVRWSICTGLFVRTMKSGGISIRWHPASRLNVSSVQNISKHSLYVLYR